MDKPNLYGHSKPNQECKENSSKFEKETPTLLPTISKLADGGWACGSQ